MSAIGVGHIAVILGILLLIAFALVGAYFLIRAAVRSGTRAALRDQDDER